MGGTNIGTYVYKKYTAQNGTLLGYVVEKTEKCPDGGMQGGYWWERAKMIEPLMDILECTKFYHGSMTLANNSKDIPNFIRVYPKLVIIIERSKSYLNSSSLPFILEFIFLEPPKHYTHNSDGINECVYTNYNRTSTYKNVMTNILYSGTEDAILRFAYDFKAGLTYDLIMMA